jgi:hypothetical protein
MLKCLASQAATIEVLGGIWHLPFPRSRVRTFYSHTIAFERKVTAARKQAQGHAGAYSSIVFDSEGSFPANLKGGVSFAGDGVAKPLNIWDIPATWLLVTGKTDCRAMDDNKEAGP